ncbi:hypothetical protein ABE901_10920 [Enterococcus casseliflavus]|uniref:hypothetical protein n=1 Tax=Enterococcus casseliflavus TaxID=37734 RepID=UPI003D6ABF32
MQQQLGDTDDCEKNSAGFVVTAQRPIVDRTLSGHFLSRAAFLYTAIKATMLLVTGNQC